MVKTESTKYKVLLWQLFAVLILIATGTALYLSGVIDWSQALSVAQDYSQSAWTAVVLILAQALLYMFALPGSIVFWIVALIYPPVTATLILVTSSTLGALAAYWLARRESMLWATHIQRSHIFHLLEKRGDFFTLSALRTLPNFPHSVINYGAGILRLPIKQFLAASIIGFTIKNFLYTNAVHGAVSASDPAELLRFEIVGPLVILTVMFVIAELLRAYWLRVHKHQ